MAAILYRRKGDLKEQILTQEGTLEDKRLSQSDEWEVVQESKNTTREPAILAEVPRVKDTQ